MLTTSGTADTQAKEEETLASGPRIRMLSAALEYAGLGLRVVPLRERSKVPSIVEWPEKATIDPATINRWFADRPASNVGIAGGCGIVIVDVDTDKGGVDSLCSLVAQGSPNGLLPATAQVYTGSGGFHVYFRVPAGAVVRTGRDVFPGLPGLDIPPRVAKPSPRRASTRIPETPTTGSGTPARGSP